MTTIPPTLPRLLAGGCALALILTACGGAGSAGDPAPADASPDGSAAGATATTEAGGGATTTAARWISPLDEFLGFGVEPSAEQLAEDEQRQRQVEELIASCMHEQGFDYVPYDPSTAAPAPGPWDLPPDEFARQYGYGITTIDRDDVVSTDPNSAMVEAMTVPERQAYYLALYGDAVTVDADGDLTKRTPEPAGAAEGPERDSCSATASAEVYGDTEERAAGGDEFGPLQEEMGALYERVDNDARVADARAAWSACMADAGYPGLEDVYDASVDVSDRATEVLGQAMDPAAVDPAVLADLRADEIAVAVADFACRADFDAVRQQVQAELEQSFIDDHRAELEQYRDAIAAGDVGVG